MPACCATENIKETKATIVTSAQRNNTAAVTSDHARVLCNRKQKGNEESRASRRREKVTRHHGWRRWNVEGAEVAKMCHGGSRGGEDVSWMEPGWRRRIVDDARHTRNPRHSSWRDSIDRRPFARGYLPRSTRSLDRAAWRKSAKHGARE